MPRRVSLRRGPEGNSVEATVASTAELKGWVAGELELLCPLDLSYAMEYRANDAYAAVPATIEELPEDLVVELRVTPSLPRGVTEAMEGLLRNNLSSAETLDAARRIAGACDESPRTARAIAEIVAAEPGVLRPIVDMLADVTTTREDDTAAVADALLAVARTPRTRTVLLESNDLRKVVKAVVIRYRQSCQTDRSFTLTQSLIALWAHLEGGGLLLLQGGGGGGGLGQNDDDDEAKDEDSNKKEAYRGAVDFLADDLVDALEELVTAIEESLRTTSSHLTARRSRRSRVHGNGLVLAAATVTRLARLHQDRQRSRMQATRRLALRQAAPTLARALLSVDEYERSLSDPWPTPESRDRAIRVKKAGVIALATLVFDVLHADEEADIFAAETAFCVLKNLVLEVQIDDDWDYHDDDLAPLPKDLRRHALQAVARTLLNTFVSSNDDVVREDDDDDDVRDDVDPRKKSVRNLTQLLQYAATVAADQGKDFVQWEVVQLSCTTLVRLIHADRGFAKKSLRGGDAFQDNDATKSLVAALVRLVEEDDAEDRSKAVAAKVLAELCASSERHKSRIAATGVSTTLVDLLREQKTPSMFHRREHLALLARLATLEKNLDPIYDAGAVDVLAPFVEHSQYNETDRDAMQILFDLAQRYPHYNADVANRPGVIDGLGRLAGVIGTKGADDPDNKKLANRLLAVLGAGTTTTGPPGLGPRGKNGDHPPGGGGGGGGGGGKKSARLLGAKVTTAQQQQQQQTTHPPADCCCCYPRRRR